MDNLNQRSWRHDLSTKEKVPWRKGTTRFSRKSRDINASKGNAIPNQKSHCP